MLVFFVILALTSESLCGTICTEPVCEENEILVDCRTVCPPRFCNISYTSYGPCDPNLECEPGCDCTKDYLRDNNGRCVFNEKCPPPPTLPECGEFEEPSECGIILSQPHDPAIDLYSKCQRCKCIDKYVRDSYGACVPSSEPVCEENEILVDCRTVCPPPFCNISYTSYAPCVPNPKCEPGCDCIKDYLRDNNGRCVYNENCPPPPTLPECGEFEEPSECGIILSQPHDPAIDLYSKCQRCKCIDKYVRDSYGACVPSSEPVCEENEILVDCRTVCPPPFCNISYTSYAPCVPNPKCEPGCDCIKDYLRDNNGRCVYNENCPPPPTLPECGEFEEPSECGIILSQPHDPAIDLYSKCQRCKCIDKYVRDSYGACVPSSEPVCEENEILVDCRTVCPPPFCNISYTSYAPCDPNPKCEPGCDCIKDYLRDNNGRCVYNENCPPPPTLPECGEFEEPSECGIILSQPHDPAIDLYSKCQRCKCIDKYVRDSYGACVPSSEPVCEENEILVDCRTVCPPPFCNISYTSYAPCDPNPKCEPGCDCIKDYLRDNNGRCVYNENCPPPPTLPECGEFEEPSECGIILSQPHDPAIDLYSKCQRCKCIDKYVRDSYGACVPIPPAIACGRNEEASVCKKVCPPQSCDWDPEKYACKAGPCQPGCNCVYGYLRDDNGDCISQEECSIVLDEYDNIEEVLVLIDLPDQYRIPKKGSSRTIISTIPCNTKEPGETPCIYDQCTPTCSIPNPPNCPQISAGETNRCNCANGYILSEEGGQCITIQDCQSRNTCRQNETLVSCNFGCPTNNCPENDNRAMVACDPPYPCLPGCACQANYKRISYTDDRCIAASDCPPVNCTRQYEVWNSCPGPCFTDKCGDLKLTPQECATYVPDCKPQCVCQENYCRNDSEICIPVSKFSAE